MTRNPAFGSEVSYKKYQTSQNDTCQMSKHEQKGEGDRSRNYKQMHVHYISSRKGEFVTLKSYLEHNLFKNLSKGPAFI